MSLSDVSTDNWSAIGIYFNNGFLHLITSADKPGHEIVDKLFHHPTHDKVKMKMSICKVLFIALCYFFVWSFVILLSNKYARLCTHSTCFFFTRNNSVSTLSTSLFFRLSTCTLVILVCPLVVSVYPFEVLVWPCVCPLVALVVLSVVNFVTDFHID